LLQPDEKYRMTANQALLHPFLEQAETPAKQNSPKRERKASIRQINFVPSQRKSVFLQTETSSQLKLTSPTSSNQDGNQILDSLMETIGTSPPHSPTHSPRASFVSPPPGGEHVPLSDTLKHRRTSRRISVGYPKDKFSLGMDELRTLVGNVRLDCAKVGEEVNALLQELKEGWEEVENYQKILKSA